MGSSSSSQAAGGRGGSYKQKQHLKLTWRLTWWNHSSKPIISFCNRSGLSIGCYRFRLMPLQLSGMGSWPFIFFIFFFFFSYFEAFVGMGIREWLAYLLCLLARHSLLWGDLVPLSRRSRNEFVSLNNHFLAGAAGCLRMQTPTPRFVPAVAIGCKIPPQASACVATVLSRGACVGHSRLWSSRHALRKSPSCS